MDGVGWDVILQFNQGADQPALAVILNGSPAVIAARLTSPRGRHSRFERQPGSSETVTDLYTDTATGLADGGLATVHHRHHHPQRGPGRHDSDRPHPRPTRRLFSPGAAMNPPGLSLLTFNIGNPSPERAQRQLAWLASRDEQILVLTADAKASAGCPAARRRVHRRRVPRRLPRAQYQQVGTMIISSVAAAPDGFGDQIGYLPSRAAAVILPAPGGPLRVIGLYVPSRMPAPRRPNASGNGWPPATPRSPQPPPGRPAIVAGDLNILEPGHQPHYPFFAPFKSFLPDPGRYARPDRRVPAPAPGRSRIQLGRPDRRRLPVRPRLLPPPLRPDHRLPLPPPAPPGQTVRSLRAHDPFQPDPPEALPVSDPAAAAEPATLF